MSKQGFVIDTSGVILKQLTVGTQADADANTPAGCTFVESSVEYARAAVDITSGVPVVTKGAAPVSTNPRNTPAAIATRAAARTAITSQVTAALADPAKLQSLLESILQRLTNVDN